MAARSSPRRVSRPSGVDVSGARTAPDAFLGLPRVWQGVEYRPLAELTPAFDLFAFAAAAAPARAAIAFGLGAWADGERLVGAVIVERQGSAAMLAGPVVVLNTTTRSPGQPADSLDIAAQLVAAAVDSLQQVGVETVFARPQGLDRVWVRFGFIPVPEGALPPWLRGRPGAGLFAYRGGSALWSVREPRSDPEARPGPIRRRSPAK